jgi:hypothetical protein
LADAVGLFRGAGFCRHCVIFLTVRPWFTESRGSAGEQVECPTKRGLRLKQLKDVRSVDDSFKGAIDDYRQLVYIVAAHDLHSLDDWSIDPDSSKLIQGSHDYIKGLIRPLRVRNLGGHHTE